MSNKYHVEKLHSEMLEYFEKCNENIEKFWKSNEFKTLKDKVRIFGSQSDLDEILKSYPVSQETVL